MALTDSDYPAPEAIAREAVNVSASGGESPVGALAQSLTQSLARLPVLHDEARQNFQVAAFLSRAPQAALLLMAAAAAVLAGDWGSLRADFAWSLLLLVGIVGITRNYIRGFARSLRRIPLHEADIVFCDWVMPHSGGLNLLRALRRDNNGRYPLMPVVVISGHATDDYVAQALGEGADSYVVKPFSARTLMQHILKVVTKDDGAKGAHYLD